MTFKTYFPIIYRWFSFLCSSQGQFSSSIKFNDLSLLQSLKGQLHWRRIPQAQMLSNKYPTYGEQYISLSTLKGKPGTWLGKRPSLPPDSPSCGPWKKKGSTFPDCFPIPSGYYVAQFVWNPRANENTVLCINSYQGSAVCVETLLDLFAVLSYSGESKIRINSQPWRIIQNGIWRQC